MIAKEILEIISKPWCSYQDIMKIANVSALTVSKIKQSIEKEFRKKEPNNFDMNPVSWTQGARFLYDKINL